MKGIRAYEGNVKNKGVCKGSMNCEGRLKRVKKNEGWKEWEECMQSGGSEKRKCEGRSEWEGSMKEGGLRSMNGRENEKEEWREWEGSMKEWEREKEV